MAVTVGDIALELVIKDQISSQLEAIKQAASSPAQRVGEAIENAVSKPVSNAASAVSETLGRAASNASQNISSSFDSAVNSAERLSESIGNVGDINIRFHDDPVEDIRRKAEQLQTTA